MARYYFKTISLNNLATAKKAVIAKPRKTKVTFEEYKKRIKKAIISTTVNNICSSAENSAIITTSELIELRYLGNIKKAKIKNGGK